MFVPNQTADEADTLTAPPPPRRTTRSAGPVLFTAAAVTALALLTSGAAIDAHTPPRGVDTGSAAAAPATGAHYNVVSYATPLDTGSSARISGVRESNSTALSPAPRSVTGPAQEPVSRWFENYFSAIVRFLQFVYGLFFHPTPVTLPPIPAPPVVKPPVVSPPVVSPPVVSPPAPPVVSPPAPPVVKPPVVIPPVVIPPVVSPPAPPVVKPPVVIPPVVSPPAPPIPAPPVVSPPVVSPPAPPVVKPPVVSPPVVSPPVVSPPAPPVVKPPVVGPPAPPVVKPPVVSPPVVSPPVTTGAYILPGDGGIVSAINAKRTALGLAPVTGTTVPATQQCALAWKGQHCSAPEIEASINSQDGSVAVGLWYSEGPGGGHYNLMMDPTLKSVAIGWAYHPEVSFGRYVVVVNLRH